MLGRRCTLFLQGAGRSVHHRFDDNAPACYPLNTKRGGAQAPGLPATSMPASQGPSREGPGVHARECHEAMLYGTREGCIILLPRELST